MELTTEAIGYIEAHYGEMRRLLKEFARIPAPSNHEEDRVAFCMDWLEKNGVKNVFQDEAMNVICPFGKTDGEGPLFVLSAHSDVVFPDTDELPYREEDGKIYCPGIGDDSVNAVILMMAARYLTERKLQPKEGGVLLVVNTGEEGLGNLRGSRALVSAYGTRIREYISFDDSMPVLCNGAIGSKRYRIEFRTEGGHSFGKFGNRNAIAHMASLIDNLYMMKVPENTRTTYNVGTISGGTSVNSIAEQAEMLYEFRSDSREALAVMEKHLMCALELYRAKGVEVNVEVVGDRPCTGEVDPAGEQALMDRCAANVKKHFGMEALFISGSTDCNMPLSAGIPAVCTGCYIGRGQHTRDEYLEISSLLPGMKLAFDTVLYYFD